VAVEPTTNLGKPKAGRHAPGKPKAGRHAPGKPAMIKKQRGFFRRFWWVFVAVPSIGALGTFGTLYYIYIHLTIPTRPPPIQTTFLYASDGTPLGQLHGAVNRQIVPFSAISPELQHAVIAVEDHSFYSEPAIDPIGMARAAYVDIVNHSAVQGGSTITQQLVKNVYAGRYVTDPKTGQTTYEVPPRTFGQKIREALLAIKLANHFTKDQILSQYLNNIYFGQGAYGVQAAAETYFGVPASKLNVLQSATLAGVISSPTYYDPIDHPARCIVRRNYALDSMAKYGYIPSAEAQKLSRLPIKTHPAPETIQAPAHAAYFVDWTKRQLLAKYGGPEVFGGGLKVTTSLDMGMQRAAWSAVHQALPAKSDPQAALVAMDPSNGQVLAMIGGRDFATSQVNLATGDGGTGRTSGSAFKPFTLAAAMEQHYSLFSRWNGPASITIPNPACYTNGAPWYLHNDSDSEAGVFTLAQATAYSVNTVFAQVVSQVGPENVVSVAHKLGITSHLDPYCSITLGTQDVTPLEMTDAYGTFAAQGIHHDPTPFVKIGQPGEGITKYVSPSNRAISANDANLVTYALQGVVQYGTGTNAQIGRPLAGKTGTAQNYVDAWFCGYTPQLVTCVWVGYPKNEIPLYGVEGVSAVYGGTIPAEIFHNFMIKATANMPVVDFTRPSFSGYTRGSNGFVPPPTPTSQPHRSPSPSPSPSQTNSQPPSPKPTPSPSASVLGPLPLIRSARRRRQPFGRRAGPTPIRR
jgi:penicillin-binding protein 1A